MPIWNRVSAEWQGSLDDSGPVTLLGDYVRELFCAEDEVLTWIRVAAEEAGLPQIQVPPETGRALETLVRLSGAKRVLEVGALGGYSAVWIARGVAEDGSVVTLEIDRDHAAVTEKALERAGVADRVQVVVGDARERLRELEPGFDAVFLDADKESYVAYLDHAARLLRSGGFLVADNALWRGEVASPGPGTLAEHVDRFNRALANDARFTSTILPVGDGLAVGVRR